MSDYSPLVMEASRKLGHQPTLVGPMIAIIVGQHREGKPVKKISEWLKQHIGPDNDAAQTEFVTWVLRRSGRT